MMPDRESTHPFLVEQVKQAELDVKAAQFAARSIGPAQAKVAKALAALATAGTVLALAEAEWAREDAALRLGGARCNAEERNIKV